MSVFKRVFSAVKANNVSKRLSSYLLARLNSYYSYKAAKNLANTSATISVQNNNVCVIYTSFALHFPHVRSELLFAQELQDAGWSVYIVYCGGLYDSCEFSAPQSLVEPIEGAACSRCKALTLGIVKSNSSRNVRLLSDVRLSTENAKALKNSIEYINSATLEDLLGFASKDIGIHEHVISTLCRQTLSSPPRLEDIDLIAYRIIATNVLRSIYASDQLFSDVSPDLLICTHGIYLNHGPVVSLARSLGISTTVWGVPYRKGTVYMTKSDTYHRALNHVSPNIWNCQLTQYERSLAIQYIESKESPGRDYWVYQGYIPSNKWDTVVQRAKSTKVYALFTNVDWDAQIFYESSLFTTQLLWLDYTIKIVSRLDSVTLVIRIHPAEADQFKSRTSLQNSIEQTVSKYQAKNVVIVNPRDELSSYKLIELSSLCLIYGSKISLEAAYRNKPTIITGNSLFRQSEFIHLPSSVNDYQFYLCNPPLPKRDQVEASIRFAYYLYFRVFQDCTWSDDLMTRFPALKHLNAIQSDNLCHALVRGTQ